MIERAAAGASLELKGASAHASQCLRLCARHERSRYPSDLRVARAARSTRALGGSQPMCATLRGLFINKSVNSSSGEDRPRRRPLTGDSVAQPPGRGNLPTKPAQPNGYPNSIFCAVAAEIIEDRSRCGHLGPPELPFQPRQPFVVAKFGFP